MSRMLLSFRFANHRSFADEHQLNLTPIYSSPQNAAEPRPAVQVVGVFGANASGKSNLLHAFSFMRRAALSSDRAVEPGAPSSLQREPFALDSTIAGSPSRYVVDILLGGVRHTYGFSLDDECVVEEWLYCYPLKKKRRIFERKGHDFDWGEGTRKDADLGRISTITAPTALFLSTVARFNKSGTAGKGEPQPLHEVYRWFRRVRTRTRPGPATRNMGLRWSALSEEERAPVIELLRAADVGIVDVTLRDLPVPQDFTDIDDNVRAYVLHNFKEIIFTHRGPSGEGLLNLRNESTGTQQLLDLTIEASIVLRSGGLMTVDEIDASLHPALTAKLIALFHNDTTNPLHSQLIFTSHDATLLGTFDTEEILQRDEIWFTEKRADGTSALYPLTDFKPRREGENRQRRYLNGSYGGVPELSTLLFERAILARSVSGGHGEE